MFPSRNLPGQQRKQVCSAVCPVQGQPLSSEAFMAACPALFQPGMTQKNILRWLEEHCWNAFAHLSLTEAFTGNRRSQVQVFRCLG